MVMKEKKVLALLKSYLNSLDFLDILFLLAGTDPDTLFERLGLYTNKINNNESITHRFSYKNLEFKLQIKNVTPTNKLDEKGQILIQHEVKFDINKVSPPPLGLRTSSYPSVQQGSNKKRIN